MPLTLYISEGPNREIEPYVKFYCKKLVCATVEVG